MLGGNFEKIKTAGTFFVCLLCVFLFVRFCASGADSWSGYVASLQACFFSLCVFCLCPFCCFVVICQDHAAHWRHAEIFFFSLLFFLAASED